MKGAHFGKLHKELREKNSLSLRKYCSLSGQDPGNISRIERGVLPPPQNEATLKKMAAAFGLKEGTSDWRDFFDTAAINAGRLPKAIMEDEELLKSLPVLLRSITGRKISDDKLNELVEIIRRS